MTRPTRTAPRFADDRRWRDPPVVRVVKRAVLGVLAVHALLALFSGYRAVWQIWRVDVRAPGPVLCAGDVVRASVVSSGRARAELRLDLVQGARVETLGVRVLRGNRVAVYDPRWGRGALAVTLTPELLARFAAGPAVLRATGRGSSQWLRIPPPTVREVRVELAR